jgi:hypothetical protein
MITQGFLPRASIEVDDSFDSVAAAFLRCNAVETVIHFNGVTRKKTRKAFTNN